MKQFLLACAIGVLCVAAGAQEARMSTIETKGIADVDAVASQAEFTITFQCNGATVLEATNKAMGFETALREALQTAELSPAESLFATPVVMPASSGPRDVKTSARLRFFAAPYVTGTEGPRDFAMLCDKLDTIAKNLQGHIEGPNLLPEDAESAEQSAIARATEKAYPPAKAVAGIMKGQILAVDNVIVESVAWNGAFVGVAELRKITCTAVVRVIYAFAPTQP